MQNITEFKRLLKSQKELQYYSGKVQILADLLQKLLALHSGRRIKSYYCQLYQKYAKIPKILNNTQ